MSTRHKANNKRQYLPFYLFVFVAIVMTLRAAMAYSAVDEGIDDASCVRGDDVRGR